MSGLKTRAKASTSEVPGQSECRAYECARCGRAHNGASTPPGWGYEPGQGLICDDCGDQLQLARSTGLGSGRRKAA